ncbi:hypothetical protein QBC37DRAFT_481186 [Rhypophila decipiens]|uniref:Uncharacterized protein n=1 Tax=Rhypophila decipiens TaxID=261697 RepID=A0AAN7BCB6_9PEZI|nr:hypothetical protein QBC37DRAFT_481186 [Rhypophila decipiens]
MFGSTISPSPNVRVLCPVLPSSNDLYFLAPIVQSHSEPHRIEPTTSTTSKLAKMSSSETKTAMTLQVSGLSFPQQPHSKDGYMPLSSQQTPQTSARTRRATATLLLLIFITFVFVYSLVMVERSMRRNGCTAGSTRFRFRLPCETGRHYPLSTAPDWQTIYD